jgi:hypothetical protein
MLTKPLLSCILDNDALTRGLGDPEARILIEWLVEQAEQFGADGVLERVVRRKIETLCRRGRAISRFVALWNQPRSRGAASQLAAAEGFNWPLPPPRTDPCEIMHAILLWEADHSCRSARSD